MSSLIYGLLSVLLLVFLGLNMQRGQFRTQDRMVVNEVATDLSGVAYSILDFIGRAPFDENTDESEIPPPIEYPVVDDVADLTADGGADWGTCTALALAPVTCDDIDDFDNLAGTRNVGGLQYTYVVRVRYVVPTNPSTPSGGRSYAKEVEVEVQNPYLTMNGAPMPVSMRRVFSYNRHVEAP